MDEGEKEEFVNITTEKIAIQVEKLEKLFSEKLYPHHPAENTIKRLCNIVAAALAKPVPISMYRTHLLTTTDNITVPK